MKKFFTNVVIALALVAGLYSVFAFVACVSNWNISYIYMVEWGQAGRTIFAVIAVLIFLASFIDVD